MERSRPTDENEARRAPKIGDVIEVATSKLNTPCPHNTMRGFAVVSIPELQMYPIPPLKFKI
jgi:hypothetical protein